MRVSQDERLIDVIIRECALNAVGAEVLNLALMKMLRTSMAATGDDEHNLTDEDGVLLLRVEKFE